MMHNNVRMRMRMRMRMDEYEEEEDDDDDDDHHHHHHDHHHHDQFWHNSCVSSSKSRRLDHSLEFVSALLLGQGQDLHSAKAAHRDPALPFGELRISSAASGFNRSISMVPLRLPVRSQ